MTWNGRIGRGLGGILLLSGLSVGCGTGTHPDLLPSAAGSYAGTWAWQHGCLVMDPNAQTCSARLEVVDQQDGRFSGSLLRTCVVGGESRDDLSGGTIGPDGRLSFGLESDSNAGCVCQCSRTAPPRFSGLLSPAGMQLERVTQWACADGSTLVERERLDLTAE